MRIHKPSIRTAIRQQKAENYLLITLLSFAFSVSSTRLFLEMTGYPQIGNNELHIAHVLWGGLLLFIASILPLIYANAWVFYVAAILSGLGVGLFIDEIGKFITQTNNYFYPAAAPIVYVFFLMTFLTYFLVKKNTHEDSRTNFYHILQDLEEFADHDLSETEWERIQNRLAMIIKENDNPALSKLASDLQEFLDSDQITLVPEILALPERITRKYLRLEEKWFNQQRMRAILTGCLTALSLWFISFPISAISTVYQPISLETTLQDMFMNNVLRGQTGLRLFTTRVSLEGAISILLLISAILFILKKDRIAILLSYVGLLLSITVVNILVFYFDQFSTIINAFIQFAVLLAILRYRHRFLTQSSEFDISAQ